MYRWHGEEKSFISVNRRHVAVWETYIAAMTRVDVEENTRDNDCLLFEELFEERLRCDQWRNSERLVSPAHQAVVQW